MGEEANSQVTDVAEITWLQGYWPGVSFNVACDRVTLCYFIIHGVVIATFYDG